MQATLSVRQMGELLASIVIWVLLQFHLSCHVRTILVELVLTRFRIALLLKQQTWQGLTT